MVLLDIVRAMLAYGQAPLQPKFEVASVKIAAQAEFHRTAWQHDFGGRPGRVSYSDVTLQELIGHAYRLRDFQIDGPNWISTNRYDVEAISPPGADRKLYPEMLQHLLAERFRLTVHKTQQQRTVYALQVGATQPRRQRASATERRLMITSIHSGQIRLTATAATMDDLVEYLMTNVRNLERPVINRTGIEGAFNFALEWVPDRPLTINGDVAGGESAVGVSIFSAVQQQLGLKLTSQITAVESLVVDHAEKTPLAN